MTLTQKFLKVEFASIKYTFISNLTTNSNITIDPHKALIDPHKALIDPHKAQTDPHKALVQYR